VQQVDDVMLDVQEQMEVNNEISEALTQGLGQQVCWNGLMCCWQSWCWSLPDSCGWVGWLRWIGKPQM
jgi:hypothetical protein